MTDSEINLAIAKIEYPDAAYIDINSEESEDVEVCYKYTINNKVLDYTSHFDYVNNLADIGPIFEREKIPISYSPIYKVWKEGYGMHDFNGRIKDKSLTKTLALCYLKTKGIE